MPLSNGTRLGPYEILTLLGAGGMGEVYKARDARLGRNVALKILPAEVSNDPSHRQRLEREARAIAGLNHPYICTLHDIGSLPSGILYLVMEYIEGTHSDRSSNVGPWIFSSLWSSERKLPTPWRQHTRLA